MKMSTLLGTWFGVGLLPKAPGTWGSLAALPFAWLLLWWQGWPALALAAVIVSIIGTWACAGMIQSMGREDPSEAVIDEVAGQWIALLPASLGALDFALGFALFRFFDIVKPWPISEADRRLKGGFGAMADDILAGVAAAVVLFFIRFALESF